MGVIFMEEKKDIGFEENEVFEDSQDDTSQFDERSFEKKKNDTIEINKSTIWKILTGIFGILFIVSLFTGGFGIKDNPTAAAVVAPSAAPSLPSIPTGIAAVNAEELTDDDPVLGDENAKVTMVEFSDYQCPFCGRHYSETFNLINSQYVDTGKIKIVFRDFPLNSIHPNAQKAAEASECADDQGKFWEMHDTLFENQQLLGIENLKGYAKQLGLNENDFNDCLDSGKYSAEVSKDTQDAASAGGQGTPFFIVGETPLSGAQPFSSFQQVIEAELAK